jgi:hypothetical protein
VFFRFSLSLSATLLLPQAVLVAGGVGTSCLPSSSEPLRGVSVFYSEETPVPAYSPRTQASSRKGDQGDQVLGLYQCVGCWVTLTYQHAG